MWLNIDPLNQLIVQIVKLNHIYLTPCPSPLPLNEGTSERGVLFSPLSNGRGAGGEVV